MSLMRTVVDLVRERGHVTADDILPYCVGVTRAQVLQAMQNARLYGWLRVKERRHSKVNHGGRLPSVYEPGDPMPAKVVIRAAEPIRRCLPFEGRRPPTSVWDLGAPNETARRAA